MLYGVNQAWTTVKIRQLKVNLIYEPQYACKLTVLTQSVST